MYPIYRLVFCLIANFYHQSYSISTLHLTGPNGLAKHVPQLNGFYCMWFYCTFSSRFVNLIWCRYNIHWRCITSEEGSRDTININVRSQNPAAATGCGNLQDNMLLFLYLIFFLIKNNVFFCTKFRLKKVVMTNNL